MYPAQTLLSAVLIFLLSGFAIAKRGCFGNGTVCHCAMTRSTGQCYSTLGDGTCISRPCDGGFKCDCSGYHLCAVSKCRIYHPDEAKPSQMEPFACKPRSATRPCISPVDFTDSIRGAENAIADMIVNHEKIANGASYLADDIKSVQVLQNSLNILLKELEKVARHLSEAEVATVYNKVEEIDRNAVSIAMAVFESVAIGSSSSRALRKAHMLLRAAKRAFQSEREKRSELAEEKARPVVETSVIEDLESTIAELNLAKKKAAKDCAREANKVHFKMVAVTEKVSVASGLRREALQAASIATKMLQKSIDDAKRRARS